MSVKLTLLLALLAPACGLDVADSELVRGVAAADPQQFNCPWSDAAPVLQLPAAPDGTCWCVQATNDAVPAEPWANRPCDVEAMPRAYCGPPGASFATWRKIGSDTTSLTLQPLPCDEVP